MSNVDARFITGEQTAQGVSCVRVEPPVETLEEFQTVCGAAYNVDFTVLRKPNQAAFDRSNRGGTTEVRVLGLSAVELELTRRRVAEALTVRHSLVTILQEETITETQ